MNRHVESTCVVLIDRDDRRAAELAESLTTSAAGRLLVRVCTNAAEVLPSMSQDELAVCVLAGDPGGDLPTELAVLRGMVSCPIIVVASAIDGRHVVEAFRHGVSDYMLDRDVLITPEVLVDAIHTAGRQHRMDNRVRHLSRELVMLNHQLKDRNDELAATARDAARVVDNVAHDLRTPLTVILQFAENMADGIGGEPTDQHREYLGYIANAAADLSRMIDDFLDSSRLKAGMLRVDRRPHALEEIAAAVMPVASERARAKSIRISTNFASDRTPVFCDLDKVARVLINLLVNAIKFSSEDQTVRLWAKPDHCGVRIGVTDHGRGMSPADLQRLGQRFRQFGDARHTSEKGFGLGLSIAGELAMLNLASLHVESKKDEGSTFSFTLPGPKPADVLNAYVTVMRGHQPDSLLHLIRVEPSSPHELEPIRQWLSSMLYPMDLILPSVCRDALLMLGATDRPDRWIARVQQTYIQQMEAAHQPVRTPVIEMMQLGTWPISSAEAATIVCLSEQFLSQAAVHEGAATSTTRGDG